MSTRTLDDVIDDGWEEITKPYSVPALVAALLEEADEASKVPESRRQLAACERWSAAHDVERVQR